MMEDNTLILQSCLVWICTFVSRKAFSKESKARALVRKFSPEISLVFAVGIVAAWGVVQDAPTLWSFDTLQQSIIAAAAAVFGHSLIREKLKLFGADLRVGAGVGAVVLAVLLSGCSSAWTPKEIAPDVQISGTADCVKIRIEQPIPTPSDWTARSWIEIERECKDKEDDRTTTPDSF